MPSRPASRSKNPSPPRSSTTSRRRGTRSESVELGATVNTKGASRRQARQQSVESNNNESATAATGRAARRASQELTTVQEDQELSDDEDIESIPNIGSPEREDEEGGSSQEPSPEPESEKPPSSRGGRDSGDVSVNNKEGAQAFKSFSKTRPRQEAGPSRVVPSGDITQTQEAYQRWQMDRGDKNKENKRPSASAPRKFTDHHPEAKKMVWNSQDDFASVPATLPKPLKRPRLDEAEDDEDQDEEEADEDEESEDEFEADNRRVDASRRLKSTVPRMVPSPKRARHEPASSDVRQSAVVEHISIEQIARTQARVNTRNATVRSKRSQIRIPWTQNDESYLVELIGLHGCSWSILSRMEGWEISDRPNFQVQLKDKARNMKCTYLKAGIALPKNFTKVRLGKKEIEAVQKLYPNYNQEDEEEEVDD